MTALILLLLVLILIGCWLLNNDWRIREKQKKLERKVDTFSRLITSAQKCRVSMNELNDCIKAMTANGATPMDVKKSSKAISKVMKNIKS